MTRTDQRLIGKRKKLRANAVEQEFPVPSGKIPAPHASREEYVPPVERSRTGIQKAETSRTMSGNVKNTELSADQGEGAFRGNRDSCRNRLDLQVDSKSPEKTTVGEKLLRVGMHRDGAPMGTDDLRGIPDMIKMPVCQKENANGCFLKFFGGPLGCIHKDVASRCRNQETVGFKITSRERFYPQCCQIRMHRMMFAIPSCLCKDSTRC